MDLIQEAGQVAREAEKLLPDAKMIATLFSDVAKDDPGAVAKDLEDPATARVVAEFLCWTAKEAESVAFGFIASKLGSKPDPTPSAAS